MISNAGAEFNNKVAIIIEKSKKSGLLLDGSAVNWNEQKVRPKIHGCTEYKRLCAVEQAVSCI